MQSKLFFYFLICCLFIVSCDSKSVFDEYKTVPEVWNKDKNISFKFNPPDALKTYNLFINLRNTEAYKYSNLFLIVEMNFPHGKNIIDTLEYKMAKPNGELLGSGLTSVKENKLWYKERVVFNEIGDYSVHIKHAMRKNSEVNGIANLKGITDIGFRIEKTE